MQLAFAPTMRGLDGSCGAGVYEEERRRGETVLFPIRLDDAVFDTREAWAGKLRANRNIGDFRQWKDHDAYRKGLERLLRDLQKSSPPPPPAGTV